MVSQKYYLKTDLNEMLQASILQLPSYKLAAHQDSLKPIFHCYVYPLTLKPPCKNFFVLPKNKMPMRSLADPTQGLADPM